MSRTLTIGVDVGTSGCKTVLLDDRARVVATSWRTYATRRRLDGEVSQDPRDWLRAVAVTVRECVTAAGPERVAGLGVTAPAHVAALVDDDGEPLTRSLLAFDGRPAETAARLRQLYGEEFFRKTFVQLTPGWTLPQLAWLHGERPDFWSRIRHVLLQKDFVVFRITGAVSTDPSDAAGTAMVEQPGGSWSPDLCAASGLTLDQLPPIRPATEHAGKVSREWARRTGLTAGTPVVVGATDTAAELVSIGATAAGASLVKIASTGTVVTVCSEPRPHEKVLTYPHAAPGLWYTLGATNTAATAYQWLGNLVLSDASGDHVEQAKRLNALAARVPPGADGVLFLPFLEGERCPYWDRDLRAAFLGVSSAHRKAHLCRAVLEGVAFSLRSCRDLLRELGLVVQAPDFTGGGSRSGLWRTIVGSVLREDGAIADPQGPAVGAALLAARGVEARPRRRAVRFRPDWSETYEHQYRIYLEAVDRLVDINHSLVATSQRRG